MSFRDVSSIGLILCCRSIRAIKIPFTRYQTEAVEKAGRRPIKSFVNVQHTSITYRKFQSEKERKFIRLCQHLPSFI